MLYTSDEVSLSSYASADGFISELQAEMKRLKVDKEAYDFIVAASSVDGYAQIELQFKRPHTKEELEQVKRTQLLQQERRKQQYEKLKAEFGGE